MNGIEFVYFDLDDTILDHKGAQNLALGDLQRLMPELATFPLARILEVYGIVNGRVWKEYAAGTRDKEGTRSGRFELLFDALGVEADAMQAAGSYLQAYSDHWSLIDGSWEAYRHVAQSFPTGLLTNGFAEAQRAKLAKFPVLAKTFSAIVISEEEGVLKPHPELFRIAGARAGVSPDRIAYVGDSLSSDIRGGLRAGWQVVWYTDADAPADLSEVPTFRDWSQLASILGI
ncbi:MAG: 5'-nucleotidase [Rhodothermales bacterium]|jgi:5'-nucleotidase